MNLSQFNQTFHSFYYYVVLKQISIKTMLSFKVFIVICLYILQAHGAVIRESVAPLIAGGNDVEQGDVPYQVSIQESGKHVCGGAILSQDYILTSGKCIQK